MDVRNCKDCGKIFNYYGGHPICPTCMTKLDEIFKQIKEYIYEHPLAGVQDVVEEFGVSVSQVHRWIREERLAFSEQSSIGIPCQACGTTIKAGRYCAKCKEQLIHGFSGALRGQESAQEEEVQGQGAKMRFF